MIEIPIKGTDATFILKPIQYSVSIQATSGTWDEPIIVEWSLDTGWVIYGREWWIDKNINRRPGIPLNRQCVQFETVLARLEKYYQKYYIKQNNSSEK